MLLRCVELMVADAVRCIDALRRTLPGFSALEHDHLLAFAQKIDAELWFDRPGLEPYIFND